MKAHVRWLCRGHVYIVEGSTWWGSPTLDETNFLAQTTLLYKTNFQNGQCTHIDSTSIHYMFGFYYYNRARTAHKNEPNGEIHHVYHKNTWRNHQSHTCDVRSIRLPIPARPWTTQQTHKRINSKQTSHFHNKHSLHSHILLQGRQPSGSNDENVGAYSENLLADLVPCISLCNLPVTVVLHGVEL